MKHQFKRILPKQKPNIPEILPCNLCGGEAKIYDWDFNCLYTVICTKCTNGSSTCINEHRAVSRWNRKCLTSMDA